MRMIKRMVSILLACLLLMGALSIGVFAEGTQDNPINANDKWFGYGVDCYLLNPTFTAGNTDGMWYTLTVEQDGILYLEHRYKDVDYTITVIADNGLTYEGGCVDGVIYNGPIMTLPVKVGDTVTAQIVTKDAAAGTVYANINIVAGSSSDPIKVKSKGITVYVGAGETVYFQDDTLNADYATKGLLVEGSIDDTVFYTATVNSSSGTVTSTAFTNSDGDDAIEVKLGGSLGSTGAPPVKPMWAIENNSTEGIGNAYVLTIVDEAHECVYDDNADMECNICGDDRDTVPVDPPVPVDNIITYDSNSVCPDVNGLAFKFRAVVNNLAVNNYVADYTNATITVAGEEYPLLGMGAVMNNLDKTGLTLEDVDGIQVVDIPVVYIYENTADTADFAVRIVNIPEDKKDRTINAVPYYIYDLDGVPTVCYGADYIASYNSCDP